MNQSYHPKMRQWRQMRQMRHFFCTLVFSGLGGQKGVPKPLKTRVQKKCLICFQWLGRPKRCTRSQKSKKCGILPHWRMEMRAAEAGGHVAPGTSPNTVHLS